MHNISIKLSVLFFLSIGSLLTALIIFPRDVSATGKSYYVSIKGNDDNDGLSLDGAFRHIGQCIWVVRAGESCLVDDGIYREHDLDTQVSGTREDPITVRAIHRHKAIVIANASKPAWTGFGINGTPEKNKQYITIDGFEVKKANYTGMSTRYADHIIFIHNISHDNGGGGIETNQSDYITIRGNTIYRNAFTSPYGESGISLYQQRASDNLSGFHNIISENISYANKNTVPASVGNAPTNTISDGNGIIIDDFRNTQNNEDDGFHTPYTHATLVENNIVSDNGGRGIHIFLSDHVTVRNNTVVGNNTSLTSDHNGDLSNVWSSHTRWYNNIAIMKPNKYKNHAVFNTSYDRENENIDVIFQNNLISSLGKDKMRLVGSDTLENRISSVSNFLGVDPLMSNLRSRSRNPANFTPATGSPATGKSDRSHSPSRDFSGTLRSITPTIGAIEVGG